jgi:hypothetical protein
MNERLWEKLGEKKRREDRREREREDKREREKERKRLRERRVQKIDCTLTFELQMLSHSLQPTETLQKGNFVSTFLFCNDFSNCIEKNKKPSFELFNCALIAIECIQNYDQGGNKQIKQLLSFSMKIHQI